MVSQPKPPDPYTTAAAQTKSNQDTASYNAALNRVSTYTPYGNEVYSQSGIDTSGAPKWRSDISLAPEAQAQLDNQLKQNTQISNLGFTLADQAGSALANPITSAQPLTYNINSRALPEGGQGIQSQADFSGVPSLPGANDYPGLVNNAIRSSYDSQAAFLDPQFANQQNDMEARLANQGINSASNQAAWGRAQGEFGRDRAFSYSQARNTAVGQGQTLQNNLANQRLQANQNAAMQALAAQEQANSAQNQGYNQQLATALQQYNQGMGNAQLNNSASGQDLSQRTALSTLPLNQLNAVRSGTQIQNPTFTQAPQANAAGTDISGLINDNYKSRVANANNTNSGLFGLGGSFLSAGLPLLKGSDIRLKHDIVTVGEHPLGIPIYEYSYKGSTARHIGVMAQDLLPIMPEAVHTMANGYMAVDYGMLG